jgi:hypothetical protein
MKLAVKIVVIFVFLRRLMGATCTLRYTRHQQTRKIQKAPELRRQKATPTRSLPLGCCVSALTQ